MLQSEYIEDGRSVILTGDSYVKYPLEVMAPMYTFNQLDLVFQTKQRNGVVLFINDKQQVYSHLAYIKWFELYLCNCKTEICQR